MTLGKKIRKLRERAGLTQKDFGKLVFCDSSRISRIESGDYIPGDKIIADAKRALNIENLPFTDAEVSKHREILENWKEFIRLRCFAEADPLWRDRIEFVTEIPCEEELTLRQSLYTARYLMLHVRLVETRELLSRLNIGDSSTEVVYEYHYAWGMLLFHEKQHVNAIKSFKTAERLLPLAAATDEGLQKNIGSCCVVLGFSMQAIIYLESAWNIARLRGYDTQSVYFCNELALVYIDLRCFAQAKRHLERCLRIVNTGADDTLKGITYHNLGDVYLNTGETDKALECFSKAFTFYPAEGNRYNNNLLYWTRALFQANRLEEAEAALEQGISLTEATTSVGICFRALRHSRRLNDADSLAYMEKTAIPQLIALGERHKAAVYCERLEEYFIRRKSPRRADKYTKLLRNLYKQVIFGEEKLNEKEIFWPSVVNDMYDNSIECYSDSG